MWCNLQPTFTLDEYEKQIEEKRAAMKKKPEEVKVDLKQFNGMKIATKKKDAEEEDVIELTNKKVVGKNKLGSEKARKEVCPPPPPHTHP